MTFVRSLCSEGLHRLAMKRSLQQMLPKEAAFANLVQLQIVIMDPGQFGQELHEILRRAQSHLRSWQVLTLVVDLIVSTAEQHPLVKTSLDLSLSAGVAGGARQAQLAAASTVS